MGKRDKKKGKGRSIGAKGRKYLDDSAKESSKRGTRLKDLPDRIEFFKEKKGTNLIDIIPYEVTDKKHLQQEVGELWYQKTIWVHFGIGVEEEAYLCPKEMKIGPCPICEHIAQIWKDKPKEEAKELTGGIRAKRRELYNVINLEEEDKGIQLWEISWHNFGVQLQEDCDDVEDENWFFANPEDGASLKVRFREAKIGSNKFLQASRVDFEDRDEPLDESLIEDAVDLDAIVNVLDYKQLAAIFLEMDPEEDDDPDDGPDTDEEEEPKRGRRSRRSRKKEEKEDPEDDPDEDPDEEDNDEEESEEDPEEEKDEPKKGKRTRGKKEKNECPHDYTFGKDTDEYDKCEDCDVWEDCKEAYDEAKKNRKKGRSKK